MLHASLAIVEGVGMNETGKRYAKKDWSRPTDHFDSRHARASGVYQRPAERSVIEAVWKSRDCEQLIALEHNSQVLGTQSRA